MRLLLIFELLLVRFFLLFELLLVRLTLHLELFSEFGVRFLERAVFYFFVGDAPFQGGELLVTTHNGFFSFSDFFREWVIKFCIRREIQISNSIVFTSKKLLRSYHDKVIRLLEVLYVVVCQQRIIHQVDGDDILIPGPGHQQFTGSP
jgi:hypothetical protein